MSEQKLSIKEALDRIKIDQEALAEMSEDDRTYFLLNTGMMYLSSMNAVDRNISQILNMVRSLIPEPIEDLKVLLSRLDDIKPDKVNDLSLGFIKQTLTVNGRELHVTVPEVGEVDELGFYRFIFGELKACDEQTVVAMDMKKNIQERFQEDIPENIRKLLGNIVEMNKWVEGFFQRKSEDPALNPEQQMHYKKRLEAMRWAKDLTPILNSVKATVEKKGNSTILFGFRNNTESVIEGAMKVCEKINLNFPFHLMRGFEVKLFGEEAYKDYKNLFAYLLARHIKYNRDMNPYEKDFISHLVANVISICMTKTPEVYAEMKDQMREPVRELLDLVINGISK